MIPFKKKNFKWGRNMQIPAAELQFDGLCSFSTTKDESFMFGLLVCKIIVVTNVLEPEAAVKRGRMRASASRLVL